ncbi:MAG: hypothetical protein FJ290_07570 [Planctomycetes bacterium]|nr:hypothetical protein [Planctomycetota bacterium]
MRASLFLGFTALLGPVVGGEATPRTTIGQYGITWTFADPARVGRYVTGDWWVVGPVTVKGVTPAPAEGRNGSAVNPPAGKRQGYDDRIAGYDASLRAAFPLALKPGQSLVTTASVDKVGDKTPDTVPGQYCRGPLRTAAVLTCVAEPPAADAFRPAYVGDQKLAFAASQLRRGLLPRLKPVGQLPDLKPLERYLERIWLDHLYEWPNRMMHPLENMPDYGREITNIVSTVSLLLLLDDPAPVGGASLPREKRHETLLLRFVQLGIDYYGVTQSDADLWRANGGHNSGRKMPILFAGVLLGHEGMRRVRASFAEDQQTYFGSGYRGQKALWTIDTTEARRHEHLPPDKWAGPPFKGDNDGWKSEAYRLLNGPTWVGQALAARLLGAKGHWNHDAFFDYVDRWVAEAADGTVDKKTMKPAGYSPFYGGEGGFIEAMWKAYRPKADATGADVLARSQKKEATR